jgi:SAM-dependent methyltransferase
LSRADELGSPQRRTFLDDRRWSSQARYDSIYAPVYDSERWAVVSPTHQVYLDRFLGLVRPAGLVLDMPCGTGKYFAAVEASGRSVLGFDQSVGMLAVARAKYPHIATARLSLQDLRLDGAADGVLCMDSLENVGPEDWPRVLTALRRAARDGAPLYVTVELPEDGDELTTYYRSAHDAGYPVIPREVFDHVREGYHYYPERETVLGYLSEAGLEIIEEGEGDEYWHLLLRRAGAPPSKE